MKICFVLILSLVSQCIFSQNKFRDSTYKVPFDTNKIKPAVILSNSSSVFSYDSLYIWNDKRTLSEVMDERPGYFVYDFGLGERNDINYNSRYSSETGVFRDGIQINDNYFQGFDIQNISVNEIDKVEETSDVSSFFYGINTFAKSINVITKDYFQSRPFSQMRFSQDRFGSLFADVFFNIAYSKKGNVQLGITKHSIDGRYENSEFDIWRGRARLNFFLSPKFNAKLNFYLDNFDRELNNGLVYSSDADSLSDANIAQVVNPSAVENLVNYYYDLTATGRFFKNSNSLTKLKLYSNNSLRNLSDPDSGFATAGFPTSFNHSVVYGADLTQNIFIKHNKIASSNFIFGGNIYLNFFNSSYFDSYQNNYFSLKTKYDFLYKNFSISAMIRNDNILDKNFLNAGLEANYRYINKERIGFAVNTGINKTNYNLRNDLPFRIAGQNALLEISRTFYQLSAELNYKDLKLSGQFFGFNYDSAYSPQYGLNFGVQFISRYTDLSVFYNYSQDRLFPQNYIKSDLAFKDILFRKHLKLKTGINIKYYNLKYIALQNQTTYTSELTDISFPQQNQIIVDFYAGARIGRANINLTVANIFNSLVYNSYVFPLDDRGGFLNAISRFTIVWDFIN